MVSLKINGRARDYDVPDGLGGGFGRRLDADYVNDAVNLSKRSESRSRLLGRVKTTCNTISIVR